jgi:hypothetical protein
MYCYAGFKYVQACVHIINMALPRIDDYYRIIGMHMRLLAEGKWVWLL